MMKRLPLPRRMLPRITLYVVGLSMTSIGVTCFVHSQLGVLPAVSVPYALSQFSPLTQGQAVMVIFSLFVLLQWLILGRSFKAVTFLQLIAAILFGYLNDLVNAVLTFQTPNTYLGSCALLGLGLLLFALGIIIYMKAGLFLLPVEGVQQAIVLSYGVPFSMEKQVLIYQW